MPAGLQHGGTLLLSVLFFFTDASEESVLMSGEKGMELNDVRSDLLYPAAISAVLRH